MDDKWFENYVYQVFVKKEFVSPEILKAYEDSSIIEVEPWDTLWIETK